MSSRSWILLLTLALIWGASFYFVEVGLLYLDPFWLVSIRLLAGALALILWLHLQGLRLPNNSHFWISVMVMGLLNNVMPFNLIAFGQQYVTGGLASIVNANTAFMGVIVSAIFLTSEPAKWNRITGVIIGIIGVAIAIGIDTSLADTDSNSKIIGQLAIVLATIAYAFAGVWGKLKLAGYTPMQGATGMLICSTIISILCSFLISGLPSLTIANHPLDLFKLVFGLGVLGTALAYPLYFKILNLADSSNLMLVTIIVPIFAVVLDAMLLGQFVTMADLIGFTLVAIGLAIMDGRVVNRLITPKTPDP